MSVDPALDRKGLVAPTPWDAPPGSARPESAPRTGSYMVSSKPGTLIADLTVSAIRDARDAHLAEARR